mgnify:CR=1 FL=1
MDEGFDILLGEIHNKALELVEIIEDMGSWRDIGFVGTVIRELRDLLNEFIEKYLEG